VCLFVRSLRAVVSRAANGGWFDPCAAVVPTITSTVTKRIWMDRNLGVDQGLDNTITSETDFRFYGSLYQWGRPSDGHEIIRWDSNLWYAPNGSTETLSATNRPVSSLFISNSSGDWRSTQNDDCGKQAAKLTIPVPLVSRSYYRGVGGGDHYKFRQCFTRLVVVGRQR
jgi:hypothetical protein